MSKHHIICKSKTLDVPIIITSSTTDPIECTFGSNIATVNNSSELSNKPTNANKFKLDKGLSLDSHCLKSQNSLSSSSNSNGMTSSSNSISSSNNSILHNFQFHNQQYLSPPSTVNSSAQSFNINADYEISVPYQNKQSSENNSNSNLHCISTSDE